MIKARVLSIAKKIYAIAIIAFLVWFIASLSDTANHNRKPYDVEKQKWNLFEIAFKDGQDVRIEVIDQEGR